MDHGETGGDFFGAKIWQFSGCKILGRRVRDENCVSQVPFEGTAPFSCSFQFENPIQNIKHQNSRYIIPFGKSALGAVFGACHSVFEDSSLGVQFQFAPLCGHGGPFVYERLAWPIEWIERCAKAEKSPAQTNRALDRALNSWEWYEIFVFWHLIDLNSV